MSLRRNSSGFIGVLACGHGYRLQGLSGSRLRTEISDTLSAGCQRSLPIKWGLIFSFTAKPVPGSMASDKKRRSDF
jgi:hypothetical protein